MQASSYPSSHLPVIPNGQPSAQDVAQFPLRVAHLVSVLPSADEVSNAENRKSTLVRLLDFTSELRLGAISLRPFFMIPAFVFLSTVNDGQYKAENHESDRLTPLDTMGFASFLIP